MRLVHLADLHLGYRQYQRQTPAGINQREADIGGAFRRVVDRVIDLRPDLILFAGDIFQNVRPTNPAILLAFTQLQRLTLALPDALVVMIAGDHDTPRAFETGCILRLFEKLGIHVVDSAPRRLAFPEHDLSILAVPYAGLGHVELSPDASARHNVLLLHGDLQDMVSRHAGTINPTAVQIPREELGARRWTYVALGHWHVCREIEPNAWYAGAIEYTSVNTWGELHEEREAGIRGKGFIERDLETGEHVFHHIEPARALVDLPPLSARGMSVEELDAAIESAIERCPGGLDEKIVRLVVRDVPRHIARELDHRRLRELKRRALHFHLDTRRPEIIRLSGQGAPGRRPTIAEIVRDKLRSRLLESDIDREALIELGLRYLREAEAAESAAAAASAAAVEPAG